MQAASTHLPHVAAAVLAAMVLGAPALADPPLEAGLARQLLGDPTNEAGVFCLWQDSGFGAFSSESAAWVVASDDGPRLLPWPSRSWSHGQMWRGKPPAGAMGIVHTHPARDGPRPSRRDELTARALGLPVMTVTRQGLWTALPGGSVVQEADEVWHKGIRPHSCSAPPPRRSPQPVFTTLALHRPVMDP